MHSTTIIGYTFDSDHLCVDHGAPFDNGEDDGAYPLFADFLSSTGGEDAVLYCGSGPDGHSFCGSCGSDLDSSDFRGPFARCWNCATESVFIDGAGYVLAGDGGGTWSDLLTTERVEIGGSIVPLSDTNGFSTVTDVLDLSTTDLTTMRVFVGFHDHDPSAGTWLVLANNWEEAYWDLATEILERSDIDPDDPSAEGHADTVAATQMVELTRPMDQLVITRKG